MMKTAVIGASGYIGGKLFAKYRETYPDAVGTGYSRISDDMVAFDLRNPDVSALQLQDTGHEAVIISSAMPLIGWCEANPKDSYALNVFGTLKLAEQLAKQSIAVYFISSDYVFDGKVGGYTDTAQPCPNTEYGRQKAEVERELPSVTNNYTILRLSKIYGTTWQDGTLIDDMAASLLRGERINVATDQFFSPTHVDDVVSMVLHVQAHGIKNVVNVCHSNKYSRNQIAAKLVDALGVSSDLVNPIKLYSIPSMKDRPLDTSLICSPILEQCQSSLWSIDDAVKFIASNWHISQAN